MSANTPTLYYLIKLPGERGMRLFLCACRYRSTLKIGAHSHMLGWTVPVKAEVTVNERARMQIRQPLGELVTSSVGSPHSR